jgi:hypothetical protein
MQTMAALARLAARVAVLEAKAGIEPPKLEPVAKQPGGHVPRAPTLQVPPAPARRNLAPVALITPKNTEKKPKG